MSMFKLQRWGWFPRFCFERSTVYVGTQLYLDRWLGYLFNKGTVRLHKFWRGDDDRASHTHPWWFITFPFADYVEEVFEQGVSKGFNVVKAWRFHYRPAQYEHIVKGRTYGDTRPFWTFVISGPKSNEWGFYPEPGIFVNHRNYK